MSWNEHVARSLNKSMYSPNTSLLQHTVNQYVANEQSNRRKSHNLLHRMRETNNAGQALFLEAGQSFLEDFAPPIELNKINEEARASGQLLPSILWYFLDRAEQYIFNLLFAAMLDQPDETKDSFRVLTREAFLSVQYQLMSAEKKRRLDRPELLAFLLQLSRSSANLKLDNMEEDHDEFEMKGEEAKQDNCTGWKGADEVGGTSNAGRKHNLDSHGDKMDNNGKALSGGSGHHQGPNVVHLACPPNRQVFRGIPQHPSGSLF